MWSGVCSHPESPAQAAQGPLFYPPRSADKVLGRLGPGIRTHALGGSGPEPPWGPPARGTLPSLASPEPRGHHTSGLPGGKGRIQDVAEQKLAGLLMPQDGDGEPQVVDLWGGGAQTGRSQGPEGSGQGQALPPVGPGPGRWVRSGKAAAGTSSAA